MKRILIIGGGFAGLKAAKILARSKRVSITLIDKKNHHLFQPLLYQVATAGLSPAEIAMPIRSIFSKYKNIKVLHGTVTSLDLNKQEAYTDFGMLYYDYLILACGAQHTYFGHEEWEEYAPGLKTLEQAIEIRRRILTAFEQAERTDNVEAQRSLLTFIVVGGGPTGVELAGAIGEMSRYTLSTDFRNIDPTLTRVMLLEAGHRILLSFSEKQASTATRDLEGLGVQVWTSSPVTHIDKDGVAIGKERIRASTVLWAAGVQAVDINSSLGVELDHQGRILVEPDLSIKGHHNAFVAGDQACFLHQTGECLPGLSPVALQQGKFLANNLLREIKRQKRLSFHYRNRGQMATIGRSRAIVEIDGFRIEGFWAWLTWLFVHIYFLIGFNNRILVFIKWASSYLTYSKGARLITNKGWRFY
ncbi:MAG: NAD(P)/FAD-dependent oxidoreductase [Deltaproteobacteria bacterium]|nr:NAD(P)/FAD-dependent oxidoreductase [Deltaproteobacteria bacterium]